MAVEGLLERIRRQEAERQLAYSALLAEAKAAGLEALAKDSVLKLLEGNSDEQHAVKLVQVSSSNIDGNCCTFQLALQEIYTPCCAAALWHSSAVSSFLLTSSR